MNIPQQLLPLSKKDKEFIRKSALAFASIATGSGQSKKNDEIAWDYYNNKVDGDAFKYLSHVGDLALPAKIKKISIQRPPINLLVSQKSRRPFIFSTVVIDEASVKEKFKNQFFHVIKQVEVKIKEQENILKTQFRKLKQQEQQIQQALQKEPETQEEAQQMQQLHQQLPEIQTAIEALTEEFEERIKFTKDELSKMRDYLSFDYKEMKEMLAQKGVKKLFEVHEINSHSLSFFIDKIVTGKGRYYVDYIPGNKNIIFEAIDSMQVHYPSIQGVKWIQDGPWGIIEDYISHSMLIDQYGDSKELTEEVMTSLEYYKEYSSGEDVGLSNANVYTGARTHSNGINRKRIWWKSPRKVFVKKTPNKHKEGEYFRHFINDEIKYDVKPNTEKGEKVVTYFMYDLYTATVIDNKYVVDGKRIEKPLRLLDNYSRTELPIIGRSYSSYSEEPYSLIWSTKDIQDLYYIVNFHRELYIAASGVKGQIIDLSQSPGVMSIEEQRYHKKTGTLYIQTVDKAGRKIQSPYNQWKDYDDTISSSIQFLEAIMNSLQEICRETMGVSRPRMGQMVSSDQVGTSEMSMDQSALITEILYYEADEVQRRALKRAINLQAKFLWEKEALLQYTNPDLSTEVVKIPSNLLNNSDYDILILNNDDEMRSKLEIKQLAMRLHEKGMLPFRNIVQMYNKHSVVELQKSVIRWADEAEKIAQMNLQNQQQAEMEAIQLKGRMEMELQALVQKDKKEIEKMKLDVEMAKLEYGRLNNEVVNLLKDKQIDSLKQTELLKIASNRDVEMQYLSEQARNNQVQEEVQVLQLRLQELQIRINEGLGTKQNELKDKEIKTTKDRDKNRIKD